MKILSKLKKVIIGIGTFVTALPVKIYGVIEYPIDPGPILYGPPDAEPLKWVTVLNVIRIISIPILLIIGLVAIIKNKKMSKDSKAIMALVAIIIAIILFWVLRMIYYHYISL